jgi:hypothetical protein
MAFGMRSPFPRPSYPRSEQFLLTYAMKRHGQSDQRRIAALLLTAAIIANCMR